MITVVGLFIRLGKLVRESWCVCMCGCEGVCGEVWCMWGVWCGVVCSMVCVYKCTLDIYMYINITIQCCIKFMWFSFKNDSSKSGVIYFM